MNNLDEQTQKQIQEMIAQEVNRRTTFNMTHQPPNGQMYFYGNQPGMGNPQMINRYGPPPTNAPMPTGNANPLPENNLNMNIGDQFLPTEDLPIFEVSMQKIENYGGKK
jgi:hypothetical protein